MLEEMVLRSRKGSGTGSAATNGIKHEDSTRQNLYTFMRDLGITVNLVTVERGLVGTCSSYILEQLYGPNAIPQSDEFNIYMRERNDLAEKLEKQQTELDNLSRTHKDYLEEANDIRSRIAASRSRALRRM